MFAPFTRSMTFSFGLFSLALSPDLLAETAPERVSTNALELGATIGSAAPAGRMAQPHRRWRGELAKRDLRFR